MLRMVRFFCLARPSASGTQKTSGSVKLRSYPGQAVADVIKQFLFNFWWCNRAISFVSSGAKKMKSATQHILTPRTIKQQRFRSPGRVLGSDGHGSDWILYLIASHQGSVVQFLTVQTLNETSNLKQSSLHHFLTILRCRVIFVTFTLQT